VSCGGDVHRVQVNPTTTSTVQEEVSVQPQKTDVNELAVIHRYAANVKKVADYKLFTDTGKMLDAAKLLAEAERSARVAAESRAAMRAPVVTSGSLADVMNCIKRAESGNYSESSHPGSGSGAFQFVPGTWRAWSARAGYPGYAYAYLAPPSVQDAVTAYTLTNGGAHNWDPAYGADSCTVGFG
jgi:hypothetical protein